MLFLSTTVLGLEDLAAQEIEKFGGKIIEIKKGKIIYEGDLSLLYTLNYGAKRIFRVCVLLAMGKAESLEEIRKIVRDAEFCIDGTFAVRTTRKGKHSFTSMDINAVVGEEILKKCPTAKVNLDAPDITFLAWLEENEFILTMDTTGESLHRRGYRVYHHPAPINPVLASLMLSFAGWRGEKLVDPFCGSGTILIEAYHNHNLVPNKWRTFHFHRLPFHNEDLWREIRGEMDARETKKSLELVGIEKFEKHIKGAIKNAQNAGARIRCSRGEAELLHKYVSSAPHIITNPPFGLRIGSKRKIFKLYEDFAEELEVHFSGTIFTLIIPYAKFEVYFEVLEKREIMYGDLRTKIYRMRIE